MTLGHSQWAFSTFADFPPPSHEALCLRPAKALSRASSPDDMKVHSCSLFLYTSMYWPPPIFLVWDQAPGAIFSQMKRLSTDEAHTTAVRVSSRPAPLRCREQVRGYLSPDKCSFDRRSTHCANDGDILGRPLSMARVGMENLVQRLEGDNGLY